MDLIPKPGQVLRAAGTLAHAALHGGAVADVRPMPRHLVDEGPLREVHVYDAQPGAEPEGDPVLLVAPLAAPSSCYDLRRGCSLVEHLVGRGRPTYAVSYAGVTVKDRAGGLDHWVTEVLPRAVRAVAEHAGGRPVHVLGWSTGGLVAVLASAADPLLPVRSLVVVAAPFDVRLVPVLAPAVRMPGLADRDPAVLLATLLDEEQRRLVGTTLELPIVHRLVTETYVKLRNLDDAELIAQLEAVDRFRAGVTAYPGRTAGQVFRRLSPAGLETGEVRIGGRDVRLADVLAPTLVVAGNTDGITPLDSVRALVPLLTGSTDVRLEIGPGGHLGSITGRGARDSTWPTFEEWFEEREAADGIGTGRARRYGSSASRGLSRS